MMQVTPLAVTPDAYQVLRGVGERQERTSTSAACEFHYSARVPAGSLRAERPHPRVSGSAANAERCGDRRPGN